MEYHSLPRKQLQSLCKKHGIPANATNAQLADSLARLFPKPVSPSEKLLPAAKEDARRNGKQTAPSGKPNDEESTVTVARQTRVRGGGGAGPTKSTWNLNKAETRAHAEPPPHQQGSGACAEAIGDDGDDGDDEAIENGREAALKQTAVMRRRRGGGGGLITKSNQNLNKDEIWAHAEPPPRQQGSGACAIEAIDDSSDGGGEAIENGREAVLKQTGGAMRRRRGGRAETDNGGRILSSEKIQEAAKRPTRGAGAQGETGPEVVEVVTIFDNKEGKNPDREVVTQISGKEGWVSDEAAASRNAKASMQRPARDHRHSDCREMEIFDPPAQRRKSLRGGGRGGEGGTQIEPKQVTSISDESKDSSDKRPARDHHHHHRWETEIFDPPAQRRKSLRGGGGGRGGGGEGIQAELKQTTLISDESKDSPDKRPVRDHHHHRSDCRETEISDPPAHRRKSLRGVRGGGGEGTQIEPKQVTPISDESKDSSDKRPARDHHHHHRSDHRETEIFDPPAQRRKSLRGGGGGRGGGGEGIQSELKQTTLISDESKDSPDKRPARDHHHHHHHRSDCRETEISDPTAHRRKSLRGVRGGGGEGTRIELKQATPITDESKDSFDKDAIESSGNGPQKSLFSISDNEGDIEDNCETASQKTNANRRRMSVRGVGGGGGGGGEASEKENATASALTVQTRGLRSGDAKVKKTVRFAINLVEERASAGDYDAVVAKPTIGEASSPSLVSAVVPAMNEVGVVKAELSQTKRGRRASLAQNQAAHSNKLAVASEMRGDPNKDHGVVAKPTVGEASSPSLVSAVVPAMGEVGVAKAELSQTRRGRRASLAQNQAVYSSKLAVASETRGDLNKDYAVVAKPTVGEAKAEIVLLGDDEEVERPRTSRGRRPALKKNQAAYRSKSSAALEMSGKPLPLKGLGNAPSRKENSASATNPTSALESPLNPDENALDGADLDPAVVMDRSRDLREGSDEAPSWDLGFEEDCLAVTTEVEEGKHSPDPVAVESCGGIAIDEGLQIANDVGGGESNHPAEGEKEAMAIFFSDPESYAKEAEGSSTEHSKDTLTETISCVADEKHGEEVCLDLLEVHDCPRPSWELSAAFTVPETCSEADLCPALVCGFSNVHSLWNATGELSCEDRGHSSESCEEKSFLSSIPEMHLKETEDCPKEISTDSPNGSLNEHGKSERSLRWERSETVKEIVLSDDDAVDEKAVAIAASSSSNQLQNVLSDDLLQKETINIGADASSEHLEEINTDSVDLSEEEEEDAEGDEAGKVGRYPEEFRGTEGNEFEEIFESVALIESRTLGLNSGCQNEPSTEAGLDLSLSALQPSVDSEEASGLIITVEEEDDLLESQISVEVEKDNVANLIGTEPSVEVKEANLANLMESEEANLSVAVTQFAENDEVEIYAKNDLANAIPTLSHQTEADDGVEDDEEESKESDYINEELKTDHEDSLCGEESPAVECIDPVIAEEKDSVVAAAEIPAVEAFGRTHEDNDLLLAEEDSSCLTFIVDKLSKFYISSPCKNSESSNVGNTVEFSSNAPVVAKLEKEKGFLVLSQGEKDNEDEDSDHPAEHSVELGSTSTISQVEAEDEICEQSRQGEGICTEFVSKEELSECPNLVEQHTEKASEEIIPSEEEEGLSESVDRKDDHSGKEIESRPPCGMEKRVKKIDYTALSLRKLRLLCKQKGSFPPSAPVTTSIMPPLLSSSSSSIPAKMIADSANMESESNTESTCQKSFTTVASGQLPPASIDRTAKKTILLANKAASEFSAKKTPTLINKRTPLTTLPSNTVQRPAPTNLLKSFQTGGSSPYLARTNAINKLPG